MRKLLKIIPFLSGYNTTVPTYHIGKVWENRVGFQLIRMLGRQLLYKIKPKFTDIADLNLFNELEENGVIRIDNFLSKDDWEKVKVEIELIRKNVPLVPYKPSKNPSMFVRRENISENKKDYPFINKLLGENINLNSLAAG
ncbi:MAG: hypothetical protein NTX03_00035, partial [Bacteroidetes bacterium]|nr:hypothetical protein [Bacteroidota bacterium]